MDPQLQAVARAICAAEHLDPDAMISATDYAGGVRADHRHEVPQWESKAMEAEKFILMYRALSTAPEVHAVIDAPRTFVPPGRSVLDKDVLA